MMKKITFYLVLVLSLITTLNTYSQCIPTSVRTISGTVTGSTGVQTFTGMPNGNVVRITAPAIGTFYTISMCATNATPQADGVNDSHITLLSANSAAATSLGFNDDFCVTTGASGYGPSEMTYTATAVGDFFVYLTEWGADACNDDGLNTSYIMTVTKTAAAPPCDAGVVSTVGSPFTVCPVDSFTVSTNGTESTPNDYAILFTPLAGATGAGGVAFNLTALTSFPYTANSDLNGVLSGQATPLPALSGNWSMKTRAVDASGTYCSTSVDSIIVNFVLATDPSCGPPPTCESGVITTVGSPFTVCPVDSFTVATNGTESTPNDYAILFTPLAGATGGTGAAINLTALTSFPYTANSDLNGVLSGQATPLPPLSGNWSMRTRAVDASGAYCSTSVDSIIVNFVLATDPSCGPPPACESGVVTTVGSPFTVCPVDSFSVATNGTEATSNDYAILFTPLAGATGAGGTAFNISGIATFPYTANNDLNGVLSGQATPLPVLSGNWSMRTRSRDALGVFCSTSVDSIIVNFVLATDPSCGPPPVCDAGVLSTVGFPVSICITDSFTLSTDGSEVTPNDFVMYLSPQATGSGGLGGAFSLTGVTFPLTEDSDLSGVLSGNGYPALEGEWAIYTASRDAANVVCSLSADSILVTFLDSNDITCLPPVGTPCTTASAGPWSNLNDAGGAPCDAGAGCVITDAGFTTVGIYSSESYLLSGVQAGFDYEFDMCSGFGAGAWIPAITIVAPSGAIDTFNLGLTGTFAQNCSLPWTASESGNYEIFIHEAGQPCTGGSQVDNGNPTVTCGPNSATCVACTPGSLVSAASMVVCSNSNDSIVLNGMESTPGSYTIGFNNTAGGTGGPGNGFTISNITGFPWTFDNDLEGILSGQTTPLPPLSGLWDLEVYNVDASGNFCDSIATIISVNFLDSTDALCIPVVTCSISGVTAGTQTACNSLTNTYSQNVVVTYINAPTTGTLDVNGQSFAITSSPQTVTLANLVSNGNAVDVTALFSADMACDLTQNSLFTAPVSCTCSITDISAGMQTACNAATNTYSQNITITYSNAPATGVLNVNGQSFAITTSPQVVTLANLVSNGNAVDVTTSFSANAACDMSLTNVFTAPVSCTCSITDVTVGLQSPCVNVTNFYTQTVTVFYVNPPTSGMLNVNGQNVAITSSPQTVTLTGLNSDGLAVDIAAAFTANASCVYSASAAFMAPTGCLCPTINVNVTTTNVTNCSSPDGTATAMASGGTGSYTYAWTPSSFGSGITISNIPSGTYSVIATDGNGCSGTGSSVVNNTSGVNALVGVVNNVSCNGGGDGEINISASGGVTPISYTWSDQGFASTVSSRNNLVAGFYTITVADNGGCSVVLGPIEITQPDQLIAVIDNSSDVSCNGANDGSINVTITGGNGNNSYVWTNGGGNNEDASGLDNGSYALTVTDAGCPSVTTSTVMITEPDAININIDNQNDVTCFGDNNGNILVTTTGGNGALSFDWDNAPDIEDAQNLSGGTYQLTVTDAAGCPSVSSSVININEPSEIVVSVDNFTDVTCFSAGDGTITASVIGGTGAMGISWTNTTSTSLAPTNLDANSYQLTVTDANMCSATSSIVTIADVTMLTATSSTTDETASGNDGTATVVASGGTPNYSYVWTPSGQTTAAASGLSAGSYTCNIEDDNGCTHKVTVTVSRTTAIGEIALNELIIYPNPSNGTFTVSFETPESLDFEISMINTIGKEVYNNSFVNVNGIFTEQLAVQGLSNGIYFLEISNRDAKTVNKITISK